MALASFAVFYDKNLMMKKNQPLFFLALMACLFLGKNVDAQTQRQVIPFSSQQFHQVANRENRFAASGLGVPFQQKKGPFIAVSIVWFAEGWVEGRDMLSIYFEQNGIAIKRFDIQPDGHAEQAPGKFVSELMFLEQDAQLFNIHVIGQTRPDSLAVHFFDPGPTQKTETPNIPISQYPNIPISDRYVCTCPQPAFEGRLDWCPDGTCPTDPTPEFVPNPTHVIVHHTAGTNIATDWAAVVRSIWDFHVNANGWDDIGYNWLVDPNGVLYEGRGDGKLGAHFCAQNGNTTGICVMGDFTSIQPQAAALNTLAEFLAWETCDESIDALGTSFHSGSGLTLMNISGHRDGCNTSCPGDMFYPLLPSVRQATQDKIDTGCDSEVLAAPTILAVNFVSFNKVSLSWQDNAVNETAYVLERSDFTDDNFLQIVQLPANATAFSDNGVAAGNTYFYRVRAKQGSFFSDYSNVAIVVTGATAAETQLLHGGKVLLAPNPTSGTVALNIDNQWIGSTEISIFDAMGRQVVAPISEGKMSGQARFQLDLSSLPSGIFWVKMVQGADMGWFRVVKN
ncbi:MAG: N-acetylmuramoyl-L-alanine amidase [Saprospiraceae bacterium]|nr:N-acetylmuramoyl-L-alanine amidase [Saprospiraceae bacterium]